MWWKNCKKKFHLIVSGNAFFPYLFPEIITDKAINFATLCKNNNNNAMAAAAVFFDEFFWQLLFAFWKTTIIEKFPFCSLVVVVVCIVSTWEEEKMKLCFGSIGRMNPENLPTNSNCFLMGSGKSRETRCCLLLHNALQ